MTTNTMNDKHTRIWQWAVLLLVLCNIGLLLTLWLKPKQEPWRPAHETPRDFVIRNLKFDEGQVARYDVLVHQHQQAMHELRHQAMEYRQQLFSNLAGENRPVVNADSLAKLIAANQQQIELVTYRHFAQVKTICTEEQLQTFDEIIGEVIKKMNGGPHPPGDGPPQDRRGRPDDGSGPPPPQDDNDAHGGPPNP